MIYRLTHIIWDTDEDNVDLPKEMLVEAEDKNSAIDVASDQTGYLISVASVEVASTLH